MSQSSLLTGNIAKGMLSFAFPLMLGNLLQQCYNLADTFIVGRFIGAGALAAVGAAYALMVFLNSVQFGLCLGSSALFSIHFGSGNTEKLRRNIYVAFMLIAGVTAVLNVAVFLFIDPLMRLLQVPTEVYAPMREYLWIVFFGLGFTFLYNFAASLLRAVGDSVTPLWALAVSVVLNIALDILFICYLDYGIAGAAWATVIAQAVSAVSITAYALHSRRQLLPRRSDCRFDRTTVREITAFSSLTCLQQSVMNFGILMVQGLVNSFGTAVMAAFAAAVKIDTLAYMPAQDFGNAFSTFIAQNFGASNTDRIRRGIRTALRITVLFCLTVSAVIFVFCRTADARICRCPGNGNHSHRSRLSAHRRLVLFRYRHSVSALRLFPRRENARHLRGAYRSFTRLACSPCLRPFRPPGLWCDRHLVVRTHRLDTRRPHRLLLLP